MDQAPCGRLLLGLQPRGSPGHGGVVVGSGQAGLTPHLPGLPQVFEFGHVNRATECTNLNEHSSRSHALLIVTVRGLDRSTGLRTTGGCQAASPSPGRLGHGIPRVRRAGR